MGAPARAATTTTAATRATLLGARARASATATAVPAAATAPSTAEALACGACAGRMARSRDMGAGCSGATAPRSPPLELFLHIMRNRFATAAVAVLGGVGESRSAWLETGAGQGRGDTGGADLMSCAAWQMWAARSRVKRGQLCALQRVGAGCLGCSRQAERKACIGQFALA